jgi:carbon dioxide concentrating mechanism protein CcmM
MIEARNASDALREIESALGEYEGEYVRLIGFDPRAKRRISETIIQRPGDEAAPPSRSSNGGKKAPSYYKSYGQGAGGDVTVGLDEETIKTVRSLLAGGYRIGTEHADPRRFKTGSWKTCSPIDSKNEAQVLQELEACIANHEGEYVRMIGIDTDQKRRVLESLIMRPEGKQKTKVTSSPASYTPQSQTKSRSKNGAFRNNTNLDPEVVKEVRSLLTGGYRIGTEHADPRRFKTGSWQTCPQIEATSEGGVLTELQACLEEHQGEYVRLIGIDPDRKRRVCETIIQRP